MSPREFTGVRRLTGRATQLAIISIAVFTHPAWAWSGKVSRVTDGDTLWVRPLGGGESIKLRMDGIDAPEICQAGGRAARTALAGRVKGHTVSVTSRYHDTYGRSVAAVSIGDEDIAGWMVRQGHAWSYRYEGRSGAYLALQGEAQLARRGLFADPHALHPRFFRKKHGTCYP